MLKKQEDYSWRERAAAAEALGKLEDRQAVTPLIDALGDGDAGVRAKAAWALAELGETETAYSHLLSEVRLKSADDTARAQFGTCMEWGRAEAVEALARINDPARIDTALSALTDADVCLRWAATLVLGSSGDTAVAGALVIALMAGESKQLRSKAAEAL